MKITNDISLHPSGIPGSSHLWVIPFWLDGKSFLRVIQNGALSLHLAVDNNNDSCQLIAADPSVTDKDRAVIINLINELLAGEEKPEESDPVVAEQRRRKPVLSK